MKKNGFTLIELIISIVLVGIILASMIGTLMSLKNTYGVINEDVEARTYSALISKVINEHIMKNNGIKNYTCSDTECDLTLGTNKEMILEIKPSKVSTSDMKDASTGDIIGSLVEEVTTIKYYDVAGGYSYYKTIKHYDKKYNSGETIELGYKFNKLSGKGYEYESKKDPNLRDYLVNITVEMNDPKYNIEIYATSLTDDTEAHHRLYTLTYNSNGGLSCIPNTETAKDGEAWGELCVPLREGYEFEGWFIQPSGENVEEVTSSSIAIEDITVYAHWTKIQSNVSRVHFNQNLFIATPGTSNGVTKSYNANEQILTLNGTWSATNLDIGLLTNVAISSGEQYSIRINYYSGSFSSSGDAPVFLFELQKNNNNYTDRAANIHYLNPTIPTSSYVTKTLDVTVNDATGIRFWMYRKSETTFNNYKIRVIVTKVDSKIVPYGSTYGTLPTPVCTKTGYTFNGWYTALNGGTEITSSSISTVTGGQTLYAHWVLSSYTLVRYAGNYMSHGNLAKQREATVTKNAYNDYTITSGTNAYGGASFPLVFTPGKKYIIDYQLTKSGGTMKTIGGHMSDANLTLFTLNGTDYTSSYKSNNFIINATGNSYKVHLEFTYKTAGDLIYLQPNRGDTTSVTVKITNLKVYEIVNEGTSKNYGTNYTASELTTVVSGDYAAVDWYNNESFTTKISTSSQFTTSNATFEDAINGEGKAYIYAKVVSTSNLSTYCSLKATSSGVTWKDKKGSSYVIDTSPNTPTSYSNNSSVGLSENTFYGHIKDSNGNTFTCSLTVTPKIIIGKYCYEPSPDADVGYVYNEVKGCYNGIWKVITETDYGYPIPVCPSNTSGACSNEGYVCSTESYYLGTSVLQCPGDTHQFYEKPNSPPNTNCYAYISATATSCPYGYTHGPYNRMGCSTGEEISGTNYCMY